MRTTWNFNTAGQLVFGRGAIDQLGEIANRLGVKRALVITDGPLVKVGLVDRVKSPLAAAGCAVEVFDGGRPDPPIHEVENAAALARDFGADVLIGLGGGSNMDLAKATAAVLAHGGSCRDYAGDQVVPGPVFPLICVPTTSGTGSEVTAAAVMCDDEAGAKFALLSNYLRPLVALVDPALIDSCPASVTADSGIDALTHAVEAYTAVDNETFPLPAGEKTIYQGRHPLGDVLAEQAIELVGRYLRRAVSDGADHEARDGMALAATTAGMSFSNVGVALVHAMEYALASAAHAPHGRGCGLLLPYVMRFNKPTRIAQMIRIATLLGEDINGLDDQEAAERGVVAVEKLKADIGIPARLSDLGLGSDAVAPIAETAFGVKRILRVNPREVTQQAVVDILEAAL